MTDPTRAALEALLGVMKHTVTNSDGMHWCRGVNGNHDATCRGMLAVTEEARAALAQPAAPSPERCARCGHVHPAPPEPRKMPCVECDCWSHTAPSPQPAEALRDALLDDLTVLPPNLRRPLTIDQPRAVVAERIDAIIAAARQPWAREELARALSAVPWEPVADPMDIVTYDEAAAHLLAALEAGR